jgi:hypothetical protein
MELLYVWIEEYNVFKDQEINFGGDKIFYDAKVDENNQLNLNCKDNVNSMKTVLDFLDNDKPEAEIINITGLVGKNGAGKTMLLRYLLNRLTDISNSKPSQNNDRFCMIFKDSKVYKCYSNCNSVKCNILEIEKIENLEGGKNLLPVFFLHSFQRREALGIDVENFRLLSTENLITAYYNSEEYQGKMNYANKSADKISKYEVIEAINETSFISSALDNGNLSIFTKSNDLPKTLIVDYRIDHLKEENFDTTQKRKREKLEYSILKSNGDKNENDVERKIFELFTKLNQILYIGYFRNRSEDEFRWKLKYLGNIILDFIYKIEDYYALFDEDLFVQSTNSFNELFIKVDSFFIKNSDDKDEFNLDLDKEMKNWLTEEIKSNLISKIINIFKEMFTEEDFIKKLYRSTYTEKRKGKLKNLRYAINKLIELMEFIHSLKVNELGKIIFNIKEIVESDRGKNEAIEFLKLIESTAIDVGNFIFKWDGLSSGQYAQLKLFSRLYYFKRENEKSNERDAELHIVKVKKIIFLLDEPDIYLHPEWQRTLMYKLIVFIKAYFKDYKVQVIYSSNNPMTISDMPGNNLVYLDKGKDDIYTKAERNTKKTFAANIYDLYADGFFLTEFIGEIPKRVIGDIIKELNVVKSVNNERATQLRNIIILIGDDVIRNKLLDMVANKIDTNDKDKWIDDTIKYLEKMKRDNVRDKR